VLWWCGGVVVWWCGGGMVVGGEFKIFRCTTFQIANIFVLCYTQKRVVCF
jgi:hypothetical protein